MLVPGGASMGRGLNLEKMGKVLGSMTSDAKAEASRMNGRLGGRPRKDGKPPIGAEYAAAIQRTFKLRSAIEEFLGEGKLLRASERRRLKGIMRELEQAANRWEIEIQQLKREE